VLNKVALSVQVNMKADLREIYRAPTRAAAEAAIDLFADKYRDKYDKAVACLTKDREALLAFFDFPAEHWDHLRTSNPIESVFATVPDTAGKPLTHPKYEIFARQRALNQSPLIAGVKSPALITIAAIYSASRRNPPLLLALPGSVGKMRKSSAKSVNASRNSSGKACTPMLLTFTKLWKPQSPKRRDPSCYYRVNDFTFRDASQGEA
jgi:hypothetical protein